MLLVTFCGLQVALDRGSWEGMIFIFYSHKLSGKYFAMSMQMSLKEDK